MKVRTVFVDFILREWLLVVSGTGFVLTGLYTGRLPVYSAGEMEVLFILFVLFVTVNGLLRSGLVVRIAQGLESGRHVALKLVAATFFLSMLVTNDVALVVVVPLTLALSVDRKDVLVILEALAANAGSALTPLGNPQNLFIYWFYGIPLQTFVKTIAPFSGVFLVLLAAVALTVETRNSGPGHPAAGIDRRAYVYGGLLVLVSLMVLRVVPVSAGVPVVAVAFLFDRGSLRVDYALLLCFLFFFGIADNLKVILRAEIAHAGHVFLFSVLASQIMSNVPAALLFAKFTPNWQALLWGVNAGGFGSLFASMANLIAYRMYAAHEETDDLMGFTVKFLSMGYVALFMAVGLYFAWHWAEAWPPGWTGAVRPARTFSPNGGCGARSVAQPGGAGGRRVAGMPWMGEDRYGIESRRLRCIA